MRRHRFHNHALGTLALPQAGEAQGDRRQRQGEADHPAAIDRLDQVALGHTRPSRDFSSTPLLHGVLGAVIVLDRPAVGPGQREHAGVFARAVARDRRWRHTIH